MRTLARRLIAAEHHARDSADTGGRTAFRVCEKLRVSLSALAGTRGFRTLLVRAVARAKVKAPWLGKLEVGKDGTLLIPELLEDEAGRSDAAKGGEALVTHLLELLATFIGEALTRRLAQQIWPKAALEEKSEGTT